MRDSRTDHISGSEADRASSRPGPLSRIARAYLPCKCTVEWCAALALLVLAIPVIAILGIVLKLTSPGPVFYSQMRLGLNGRAFRIYKLRTMTHLCEATTGPVWSVYPDPRITPVGKWLRDTHLDELPQLWNVLRGEMCLVGPRPERPEIAAAIERRMPDFRERLAVRPGITGLAQVRLPPDSNLDTVRQKLAHDLCYIRRLSPVMDVRVLLATGLQALGAAAGELAERCVRGVSPPIAVPPPVTAGFRMPPEIEVDSESARAVVEQPVRSRAA
jgi:lipopolysaccharide/colanic/teichoic acid biosynthesis glycosyltransferase